MNNSVVFVFICVYRQAGAALPAEGLGPADSLNDPTSESSIHKMGTAVTGAVVPRLHPSTSASASCWCFQVNQNSIGAGSFTSYTGKWESAYR